MKLNRRLLPLYIGMFLQGMVFWYAIEKLFMSTIGFDANTIALSVAIYSAAALLTEVPSGILADRWSRRGVLILSSIAIAASSLIGAISHDVFLYLVASAIWGIYISMNSGTVDSIIYDSLLEETGSGDKYEKYIARIEIISSSALVISSIIGGLVGSYMGLRETFWLSVPSALAAIIFFLFFKEPKLHLKNQDKSLIKHTKLTFSAIFSNNNLIWLAISLITSIVVWSLIMEFYQLWFIALFMPVILFGPSHALVGATFGLGGVLSNFIKSKAKIIVSMLISFVCIICLIYVHNLWASIIAVFFIMLINYSLNIVMSHNFHDSLTSNTRAGSMSAISAMRRLIVIPTSIVFGILVTNFGIFQATWFAAALFIVAIFAQLFVKYKTFNS